MTEREQALCAAADLEATLRQLGLPCVFLIGLPTTVEIMRGCSGLHSADNRRAFFHSFVELLESQATKAGGGE